MRDAGLHSQPRYRKTNTPAHCTLITGTLLTSPQAIQSGPLRSQIPQKFFSQQRELIPSLDIIRVPHAPSPNSLLPSNWRGDFPISLGYRSLPNTWCHSLCWSKHPLPLHGTDSDPPFLCVVSSFINWKPVLLIAEAISRKVRS